MESLELLGACLERAYALPFGFTWLFKVILKSDIRFGALLLAFEILLDGHLSGPPMSLEGITAAFKRRHTISSKTSGKLIGLAPAHDYIRHTRVSLDVLQDDFNEATGLWGSTGWWNAANCLTMVSNYAIAHHNVSDRVVRVLEHTYVNASSNAPVAIRKLINGTPTTVAPSGGEQQPTDFLNEFYDDEAWWALAWIRAFDLTRNVAYLATAASLFDDMIAGHNAPCGGIWWNKAHAGEVAITNSLFIETAAALANRAAFLPLQSRNGSDSNDGSGHSDEASSQAKKYHLWAVSSWTWFNASGLLNGRNLVNDGLNAATCRNNGGIEWSYNQGALISGLVELFGIEPDPALLARAAAIATATITHLTDANGILHDVCEPACGGDGTQFKGVFLRALARLHAVQPNPRFAKFITRNADSILKNNRNGRNELSVNWAGPFIAPANASTHCSAMDALVAALELQSNT